MAIEFDCPYCTATIRVPDAYGGKQGRCPKCDTRLLVPLVVRPGSTTVPDASSSPITANQSPAIPGALPQTDIFAVPAPPTSPMLVGNVSATFRSFSRRPRCLLRRSPPPLGPPLSYAPQPAGAGGRGQLAGASGFAWQLAGAPRPRLHLRIHDSGCPGWR